MGPRSETVVMVPAALQEGSPEGRFNGSTVRNRGYGEWPCPFWALCGASMGPRSETVVMDGLKPGTLKGNIASMGPRSDNRGYGKGVVLRHALHFGLQWVHGPITVVMYFPVAGLGRSRAGFNGSTVG